MDRPPGGLDQGVSAWQRRARGGSGWIFTTTEGCYPGRRRSSGAPFEAACRHSGGPRGSSRPSASGHARSIGRRTQVKAQLSRRSILKGAATIGLTPLAGAMSEIAPRIAGAAGPDLVLLNPSRGMAKALGAMTEKYAKDRGVKVTVDTPGPVDYPKKLLAASQTNTMPDIFVTARRQQRDGAVLQGRVGPAAQAGAGQGMEAELRPGGARPGGVARGEPVRRGAGHLLRAARARELRAALQPGAPREGEARSQAAADHRPPADGGAHGDQGRGHRAAHDVRRRDPDPHPVPRLELAHRRGDRRDPRRPATVGGSGVREGAPALRRPA